MAFDDDFIDIIDDDEAVDNQSDNDGPVEAWNILVVDDDEGVHSVTQLALKNVHILGRPLKLFHCYSVNETKQLLSKRTDFAVILLDVVMETEDAGLQMVGFIRENMAMDECRIILRTGQPGYAPELTIFNDYDINDYRTKSELTRTRLITSITAAVRSYRQIYTISENRRGLELIIKATSHLMDITAIRSFSEGVLTQLASLLDFPKNGVVCVQKGLPDDHNPNGLYITGAAGRLADLISHPLSDIQSSTVKSEIEKAVEIKQHIYAEHYCVIYLHSKDNEGAVYIDTMKQPSEDDQRLLEVFAANMSACFNNVRLLEKLNYDAYNDPLTQLPNKARFVHELDQYTESSKEGVVALVDINHFSDLNEGLGITTADEFLCEVAKRLTAQLHPSCFIARIRGDIFGVIGPAELITHDKLSRMMEVPFQIQTMNIPVKINTGLYRITKEASRGSTILKNADVALTSSKKTSTEKYAYYSESQEAVIRNRMHIIQQLNEDFYAGKLEVWYQPQIDLENKSVWGLEALLRWPDGEGGFVHPPSTFIPLAEYSGLIVEIGEWVLKKACADFKQLRSLDNAPGHVSVNVSIPQFRDVDFLDKVENVLNEYEMNADELILEVTESLTMDDPESVVCLLQALKKIGVKSSLDDFGTGYSSLSYLKNLPIDCLKIDKAFISEIELGEGGFHGGDFASTIHMLGEMLDLTVVAEGVETIEQLQFLKNIGCNIIQGYYYAKPMSQSDLIPWLEDRDGDTSLTKYDRVI
ncbi:MAG: bifunctional diguanylate cyclase/phosphodiesterase [Neptuniibacter sp.]